MNEELQPVDPMTLNSAEAVMAFAGWLTSRKEPITFGSSHDVPPCLELVIAFSRSQCLPEIRDDLEHRIQTYPTT